MTTPHAHAHVSIDTADLAASVSFYRALLGAEPVLERRDYARFTVADPPLVLGLNAVGRAPSRSTGALEHLGVLLADEAGLAAARARLAALAVPLEDEPDTECCYARLARVWAADPSGVRWELLVAREPVVDAPSRAGSEATCCEPGCCATLGA